MFRWLTTAAFAVAAISAVGSLDAAQQPRVQADSQLAAGRYLVVATGCNHCHTQNWAESNGKIPQSKWLTGGHAPGPNGPAAPSLRAITKALSRAQFVAMFRTKQPPSAMPWFNVDGLSDTDLSAVYAFVRSLQ